MAKKIKAAKKLDFLKSKFIEVVSHQLRTPLSAVRWNLESLLEGEFGGLKKEQKRVIKEALKSDINVINIINDLVTALDIERGEVALNKKESDLAAIVGGVLKEADKQCKLKQLKCRLEKGRGKLPPALVDEGRIRIVLDTLLNNAISYTPERGTVNVKLEKKKGQFIISIKDSGIGIPPKEQKNIFNRFYRGSNATKTVANASGLGLYIAKNFVEAHGGKIWFESQEGKGTTFYVSLPV